MVHSNQATLLLLLLFFLLLLLEIVIGPSGVQFRE